MDVYRRWGGVSERMTFVAHGACFLFWLIVAIAAWRAQRRRRQEPGAHAGVAGS
jgi:hypothetical protein